MANPDLKTRAVSARPLLLGALAVCCVLFYQLPLTVDQPVRLALTFWAAWAVCLSALISAPWGGLYRPSAIYLVVFGFFHGGLLVALAVRGPDLLANFDATFAFDTNFAPSVRLAMLGMFGFTIGALLFAGAPPLRDVARGASAFAGTRVGPAGVALELLGVVLFFITLIRAGGLGLLSGGYLTYIEGNSNDGLAGYSFLCVGMGAVLAILSGGRSRRHAWMLFLVFAAISFPLGQRSSALFPLAAMLVAEARCGRRLRRVPSLVGALVISTAIGIVREARVSSYAIPDLKSLLQAPLDALAEMGGSLRTVVIVQDWHSSGEAFRKGSTLTVWPVRMIEQLTGWHGGPPEYDDRLFNVEIAERAGPLGGSPIAEGYHNGGLIGVFGLMFLLGLFMAWIDRRPAGSAGDLRLLFLVPLLVQIRNSFGPLPAWIVLGGLLVFLIRRLAASGAPSAESSTHVAGEESDVREYAIR